jgi:hypothetical protein
MEGYRRGAMVASSPDFPKSGIVRELLGAGQFLRKKHPAVYQRYRCVGSSPMKPAFCLIAASLVACACSVYAMANRVDGIISLTRSFSLNGRWYSVGKPSGSDSLIREALTKRGFDVTRIPQETEDQGDISLDTLSEQYSKIDRFRPYSFPFLFQARNSLQMESDAGVIDITYGNVSRKGNYARKNLAAKGWKIAETGKSARPVSIATNSKGRETFIVFLEENEGTCLFIRQLEK